ncbi:MAG: sigma-70 family RNA polymerase sigma factor [Planctomycetota bacterium]
MTTDQRRTDDLELVRRTLTGDEEAVACLAERMSCIPGLLGGIHRRARRPIASDLLDEMGQEVAMRVWRDRASFNGTSRLETWVYPYAQFVYREAVRKQARTDYLRDDETCPDETSGTTPEVEQILDDRDEWARVEAALDTLSPEDSALIEKKLFIGSTFSQIEAETGTSANTLKARYYRALKSIGKAVAQLTPGSGPPLDSGTGAPSRDSTDGSSGRAPRSQTRSSAPDNR